MRKLVALVLTCCSIVMIAGAGAAHAQDATLVAPPPAGWTLIASESGPLSSWPQYADAPVDLSVVQGELRGWRGGDGISSIVVMIVGGDVDGATSFLEGFRDTTESRPGFTSDCADSPEGIETYCGLVEGEETAFLLWQSGDIAVTVTTFAVPDATATSFVDAQRALLPPGETRQGADADNTESGNTQTADTEATRSESESADSVTASVTADGGSSFPLGLLLIPVLLLGVGAYFLTRRRSGSAADEAAPTPFVPAPPQSPATTPPPPATTPPPPAGTPPPPATTPPPPATTQPPPTGTPPPGDTPPPPTTF